MNIYTSIQRAIKKIHIIFMILIFIYGCGKLNLSKQIDHEKEEEKSISTTSNTEKNKNSLYKNTFNQFCYGSYLISSDDNIKLLGMSKQQTEYEYYLRGAKKNIDSVTLCIVASYVDTNQAISNITLYKKIPLNVKTKLFEISSFNTEFPNICFNIDDIVMLNDNMYLGNIVKFYEKPNTDGPTYVIKNQNGKLLEYHHSKIKLWQNDEQSIKTPSSIAYASYNNQINIMNCGDNILSDHTKKYFLTQYTRDLIKVYYETKKHFEKEKQKNSNYLKLQDFWNKIFVKACKLTDDLLNINKEHINIHSLGHNPIHTKNINYTAYDMRNHSSCYLESIQYETLIFYSKLKEYLMKTYFKDLTFSLKNFYSREIPEDNILFKIFKNTSITDSRNYKEAFMILPRKQISEIKLWLRMINLDLYYSVLCTDTPLIMITPFDFDDSSLKYLDTNSSAIVKIQQYLVKYLFNILSEYEESIYLNLNEIKLLIINQRCNYGLILYNDCLIQYLKDKIEELQKKLYDNIIKKNPGLCYKINQRLTTNFITNFEITKMYQAYKNNNNKSLSNEVECGICYRNLSNIYQNSLYTKNSIITCNSPTSKKKHIICFDCYDNVENSTDSLPGHCSICLKNAKEYINTMSKRPKYDNNYDILQPNIQNPNINIEENNLSSLNERITENNINNNENNLQLNKKTNIQYNIVQNNLSIENNQTNKTNNITLNNSNKINCTNCGNITPIDNPYQGYCINCYMEYQYGAIIIPKLHNITKEEGKQIFKTIPRHLNTYSIDKQELNYHALIASGRYNKYMISILTCLQADHQDKEEFKTKILPRIYLSEKKDDLFLSKIPLFSSATNILQTINKVVESFLLTETNFIYELHNKNNRSLPVHSLYNYSDADIEWCYKDSREPLKSKLSQIIEKYFIENISQASYTIKLDNNQKNERYYLYFDLPKMKAFLSSYDENIANIKKEIIRTARTPKKIDIEILEGDRELINLLNCFSTKYKFKNQDQEYHLNCHRENLFMHNDFDKYVDLITTSLFAEKHQYLIHSKNQRLIETYIREYAIKNILNIYNNTNSYIQYYGLQNKRRYTNFLHSLKQSFHFLKSFIQKPYFFNSNQINKNRTCEVYLDEYFDNKNSSIFKNAFIDLYQEINKIKIKLQSQNIPYIDIYQKVKNNILSLQQEISEKYLQRFENRKPEAPNFFDITCHYKESNGIQNKKNITAQRINCILFDHSISFKENLIFNLFHKIPFVILLDEKKILKNNTMFIRNSTSLGLKGFKYYALLIQTLQGNFAELIRAAACKKHALLNLLGYEPEVIKYLSKVCLYKQSSEDNYRPLENEEKIGANWELKKAFIDCHLEFTVSCNDYYQALNKHTSDNSSITNPKDLFNEIHIDLWCALVKYDIARLVNILKCYKSQALDLKNISSDTDVLQSIDITTKNHDNISLDKNGDFVIKVVMRYNNIFKLLYDLPFTNFSLDWSYNSDKQIIRNFFCLGHEIFIGNTKNLITESTTVFDKMSNYILGTIVSSTVSMNLLKPVFKKNKHLYVLSERLKIFRNICLLEFCRKISPIDKKRYIENSEYSLDDYNNPYLIDSRCAQIVLSSLYHILIKYLSDGIDEKENKIFMGNYRLARELENIGTSDNKASKLIIKNITKFNKFPYIDINKTPVTEIVSFKTNCKSSIDFVHNMLHKTAYCNQCKIYFEIEIPSNQNLRMNILKFTCPNCNNNNLLVHNLQPNSGCLYGSFIEV